MSTHPAREQVFAEARRLLDQFRAENAAAFAEGRMDPERAAAYERLLLRQRQQQHGRLAAAA
ncbi:hypothetical protein [Streptomyces sp. NPDC002644]